MGNIGLETTDRRRIEALYGEFKAKLEFLVNNQDLYLYQNTLQTLILYIKQLKELDPADCFSRLAETINMSAKRGSELQTKLLRAVRDN